MKLQKLVVVMSVLAGGIASINSHALGLGEVKLYSTLNQPLVAEIELMQVNDLTRSEILSNLARKSDFERAGVDRPFILNNLRFKTEVGPDGKGVIKVTSDGPVHEPYLNFLVEVHWPSGRLLKEYTLLLDPPAFNGQASVPVAKPTTAPPHYGTNPVWDGPTATNRNYMSSPAPVSDKHYHQRHQVQQVQQVQRGSSGRNDSLAGRGEVSEQTYRVNRNDSLWEIAERVRPDSDVTVQQTMLAIQRGNPQAFIDNNINRLKSGQVLRVPSRSDITRLTVREAIVDVSRQNRDWQGRSQIAQLDATRRSSAVFREDRKSVDGKLAIISGDAATGRGQDLGGDGVDGSAVLQTELAMTREQLDKLSRENTELKSRLKDLDDQIATLKRLVAMKDDQMAALQGGQNQTKPAPVSPQRQPEPVNKPGMMDAPFGNPLMLLLLALIPLGGAGWLFYQRRKKQQETLADEDDTMDFQPPGQKEGVQIDASPKPVTPSVEDKLKFDQALAIDDSIIEEVETDDGETTQQTEDPLSEADIYIAYGRLNQAEELLNQAIFNEPGRTDLKLKLLEVHSESGELDKFNQALADLEATGDADAIREADAFKARFPDAFEGVSANADEDEMPDLNLDDLELEADEQGVDSLHDLDFDLDDFDGAAAQPEVSKLDDLNDLDLDFGLETEDNLAQDSHAAFSDKGGSNLEASLDDDLDFLSEGDEVATKLDLARAYMDMGDMEGASDILQEVIEQGSDEQKREAISLMENAGAS